MLTLGNFTVLNLSHQLQNYKCQYCSKKYSKERYLSEHLRNIHGTRISKKSTRIICPYDTCEEHLYSFVKLRSHLSEIHQTDVELEELTFDSISGMYTDLFSYYLNKLPLY